MHKASKVITVAMLALIFTSLATFVYSGRCLKWAIDNDKIPLLDKFLWMGAPVGSDFGEYGNPLIHAVSTRNINAIHVLVRHGANVNIYPFRDLSLLAWAYSVAQGPEVGEALISVGANVNSLAVPSSRKTVLMYLLSSSALDIRKISSVIKYGPDLQIRDAHGQSSVDYILKRESELRALGWRNEDLISLKGQRTDAVAPIVVNPPPKTSAPR